MGLLAVGNKTAIYGLSCREGRLALTKALGTALTAGDPHNGGDGPSAKLGPVRSKRVAFYAEDGVVKASAISEAPDDPAGERRELHYFLS